MCKLAIEMVIAALAGTLTATAQTDTTEAKQKTITFVGGGQNGEGPRRAYTLGNYNHLEDGHGWGLDISLEGSRIDRTGGNASLYGEYTPSDEKHVISYNVLLGRKLSAGSNGYLIGGLLAGIRTAEEKCASGQSHIGFDCYADEEPESEYKLNGGVFLGYKRASFFGGLRVTRESAQFLVGHKFQ